MKREKGVSPVIAVLLLVALSVSLVVLFTIQSGDIISDTNTDIEVPNVDTEVDGATIETRLLEDGTAEEIWLVRPDGSSREIETVGTLYEETITEEKLGEYRIVAYDDQGRETLVDSFNIGEAAEDNVGDLELVFVGGSTSVEGDDGVRFEVKNIGEEDALITGIRVNDEDFNGEKIDSIDTDSPPTKEPYEVDIRADGESEDGFCGKQPSNELPTEEVVNLESDCQAYSNPSVAAVGDTIEIEINGIELNGKDLRYFTHIGNEDRADMTFELIGPTYDTLEIPFVFNRVVVPLDGEPGQTVEEDIDEDFGLFSDGFVGPIEVVEDTTIIGDIQADDIGDGEIPIHVQDGVEIKGDVDEIGVISGGDDVTVESVDEALDISLGDGAELTDIDEIDGEEGLGNVILGDDSTVSDDIDEVTGDLVVGSDSEVGSIDEVGNDLTLGDGSVIGDIDDVGGTVDIGAESTIGGEKGDGDIDEVDGDVELGDDVTVEGDVDDVGGEILCGDNVTIEGDGECDDNGEE